MTHRTAKLENHYNGAMWTTYDSMTVSKHSLQLLAEGLSTQSIVDDGTTEILASGYGACKYHISITIAAHDYLVSHSRSQNWGEIANYFLQHSDLRFGTPLL